MRNMEKRRIECENKGMRLSPNGDCESITPPVSPTASGQRKSIGRYGEGMAEYLNELREEELRKKMDQFEFQPPPSDDEWSDEETTQADRDAGRKGLRKKRR